MPVIKATSLRDLKNRVNIHDVVVRTVALKKAGSGRFKGLCPFHSEKTPSFHVTSDKGFYKCFGCGKAGDVISFVMETEGLQFTEAVEAIAQRFGVALEYEEGSGAPSARDRSVRQEIFEIHDLAGEFYRQAFLAATPHGDYIRRYWVETRRFTAELAEEFKIGFAPVEDTALAAQLLKRKFSEDALRQCGLFFARDGAVLTLGALRPRFRGRLMIPIRDHQGRVVAFTARQLELTPKDDASHEAKYVNSPETPIFTKSNLLFNLDRARTSVGEGRPFVLVEGQLDALRCWSVGLKTAIAPQGTSITEGQLALLRRYDPRVECFLDGDAAGQKAAMRFLPMALKAGLEVKFLVLPKGEDPDSLFRAEGLAAYERVRRGALGAMEFACCSLLPDVNTATPELRARAARELLEIVAQAESEVSRIGLMRVIAEYFGIRPSSLEQEMKEVLRRAQSITRNFQTSSEKPKTGPAFDTAKQTTVEEHLLFLGLSHSDHLSEIAAKLPDEWIDETAIAGKLLARILNEVRHNGWEGDTTLNQIIQNDEERTLIARILFDSPDPEDVSENVQQGLYSLRKRFLERRLVEVERLLASSSARPYEENVTLWKEQFAIKKELNQR